MKKHPQRGSKSFLFVDVLHLPKLTINGINSLYFSLIKLDPTIFARIIRKSLNSGII